MPRLNEAFFLSNFFEIVTFDFIRCIVLTNFPYF